MNIFNVCVDRIINNKKVMFNPQKLCHFKDNVIKTVKMWRAPNATFDDGVDG